MSISTLPIGNWFELHRTNDKKQLTRNRLAIAAIYYLSLIPMFYVNVWLGVVFSLLGIVYAFLEDRVIVIIYDMIYDEFIERIGLNKEYLDFLNMTKRIAFLKLECAIESSSINLTHLEIELKKLEKKGELKQTEYNKIIAKISKSQGYRINPKEVTVLEFYSYING